MKIAIVTNKPYASCETFIKAQINLLPFEIVQLYGVNLPFQLEGRKNQSSSIFKRMIDRLIGNDAINQTVKVFKSQKIDVVLAQYGMEGATVLPICRKLKLPLVVHFHGHDAVRNSVIKKYKYQYKEMFDYATKIISVSHEMSKRLISIGCLKEKIAYNPYGPNDEFFNVKTIYSKDQFIAIGRFVEKKAPHLLILAFHKVIRKYGKARLVIAGDGALLDSCKDLVFALGIENHVNLPGRISPEEYKNYLKESIAFVQHSIEAQDGDMEGTPVAILEASAAGLPIISTKHAGIPDVVIDGETGLFCRERDINAMADNMIWVLENRDAALEMGKKGKERIKNNFSMKRHIDGLTKIIESSKISI